MESLAAASSADAPAFVSDWLATWQASSTAASEGSLPLGARPDVQKDLVCPWLRLTPENACDATCAHCASSKLDLSRAPFRLSTLPFAHVGVDASGATILSRFLSDPSAPDGDELAFRGRSLARRVSGQCGSADASYGGRHGMGGGGLEVTPDRVVSAQRVH